MSEWVSENVTCREAITSKKEEFLMGIGLGDVVTNEAKNWTFVTLQSEWVSDWVIEIVTTREAIASKNYLQMLVLQ